jgi:hypothetical protein
MKKLEFRLGVRNNSKAEVRLNFIFTEKGDIFVTSSFKEKLYKATKISIHPPKELKPNNYQSFSFQKDSVPGIKNDNRHIQQTVGNFDVGSGLNIRQVLLIHYSLLQRKDMFKGKEVHGYIDMEDDEDILDITLLSSKNKFTGTPGKKDGYQKIFDVNVEGVYQICLIFKGRKIKKEEDLKLKEFAEKRRENIDGVCALIGNSDLGYPVITYIDTNYIKRNSR